MANRTRQAFVTPDEFVGIVDDCRRSLGLVVVLDDGRNARHVWNRTPEDILVSHRVFLADDSAIRDDDLLGRDSPARLGWVSSGVPRIEDDVLYSIQLGARGDWFDGDAGIIRDTKEALRLFDRVWKRFAPCLHFPIRAKNRVTGAEASYASFGFSAGAATWWTRGGRLRQCAVANIEFMIPDVQSA